MTAHRLLATCLLLSAPADVFAEMIGSPVSHPDAGRFSIGATGEVGAVLVNAQDCEGDACQAVWRPAQVGGRADDHPDESIETLGVGAIAEPEFGGDRR